MAHETENKAKREDRVQESANSAHAERLSDEKAMFKAEADIPAAVGSVVQEPIESMAAYWARQDYCARRDRELQAEQAFISGMITFGHYVLVLLEVL